MHIKQAELTIIFQEVLLFSMLGDHVKLLIYYEKKDKLLTYWVQSFTGNLIQTILHFYRRESLRT